MWAFRRPEVDNDNLPAIITQLMRNTLKIRQFKIRHWLVKLHENHYIVGSSELLALSGGQSTTLDWLHSLARPVICLANQAGVHMRLATQRQVQVRRSARQTACYNPPHAKMAFLGWSVDYLPFHLAGITRP